MARRPSHTHRIKKGRILDWPDGYGTPEEIASRVTYRGNPKHKTYQSPAGAPAHRSDAAKCDKYPAEHWPMLESALRQAIRAGCVSDFRGSFPARAWVWINDVLHEARQTIYGGSEYHGFPINDPSQYPQPIARVEAAPRVQIPVA